MKIRNDHRKPLVLRIFEKYRFRNTNNDIGIAAQYLISAPDLTYCRQGFGAILAYGSVEGL